MKTLDLNCDLGEGMPNDEALMPLISSANIACGFHAGNHALMEQTIALCLHHHVAIGAHPGFRDKSNFGRQEISLSDTELYDLIAEQLLLCKQLCKNAGSTLHHVKLHGALYTMAAKDSRMSTIVASVIAEIDPLLIVYGLSGSVTLKEASKKGLATASEVFADRSYQNDGSLTPRSQNNALIEDTQQCLSQVLKMVNDQTVISVSGNEISIQADTLCLHGDGSHALSFAKNIRTMLDQHSINVQTIPRA